MGLKREGQRENELEEREELKIMIHQQNDCVEWKFVGPSACELTPHCGAGV
jgi:hypothetical protein